MARLPPIEQRGLPFGRSLKTGKAKPVSPSETFDLTRRSLRVRQSFVNEILKPRTSRTELKKLLGDDRAAVNEEEWTEEERQKVADAQTAAGQLAFQEKVFAALETLEEELDQSPAAYVSSGMVYVRGEREGTLQTIDLDDTTATGMCDLADRSPSATGRLVVGCQWMRGVSRR